MSSYVHTLNPFAIDFGGGIGIRWYGLSYLAGFFLGYLIIQWLIRRGKSPLNESLVSDFVFAVALGCILGGRVGYCLFYSPELFLNFTGQFPFWGVLMINKGGMASHGGMIGIVVACFLFARKHKLSTLHLFDLTILGATLGIFFGRIANFINGELVGREAPVGYAYAVKFPQDILTWPTYAPQKLELLTPILPHIGEDPSRWTAALSRISLSSSWNTIHLTLEKIVGAVQVHNETVISMLEPHLLARYPSQLFAALLEGLLIFLVAFFVWRKPQKPGVITGIFFSLYAVVRIYGEQFRLPDLHIGYQLLGLTRGQLLSVGLLLIGLTCLLYWSRRNVEKVGGWGVS